MTDNYVVNFEVSPDGDIRNAFRTMKTLTSVGMANETAVITFDGFRIPAGYLDTEEDLLSIYKAFKGKDRGMIMNYAIGHAKQIGSCLKDFLCSCSDNLKRNNDGSIEEPGFTDKEIESIVALISKGKHK